MKPAITTATVCISTPTIKGTVMAHIVIEVEKHPDRIIENTYGPFNTYEEADMFAKAMHDHDDNRIIGHSGCTQGYQGYRRFNYNVYDLTAPQNA